MAKVWHCTPEVVLQTPADIVVAALQYEAFVAEYEKAYLLLNRENAE